MEFPDELLPAGMIQALAGKEPVAIAIVARDTDGEYEPHLATFDLVDEDRPVLSAAIQRLAYSAGYPDLEVDQFFALSLVLLTEPYMGSPIMGMTAGAPFGPPHDFVKAFASILAGVSARLGVAVAATDASGHQVPTGLFVDKDGRPHASFVHPDGHVHHAKPGDELPTGQYL